jgi:hypothetical protein
VHLHGIIWLFLGDHLRDRVQARNGSSPGQPSDEFLGAVIMYCQRSLVNSGFIVFV